MTRTAYETAGCRGPDLGQFVSRVPTARFGRTKQRTQVLTDRIASGCQLEISGPAGAALEPQPSAPGNLYRAKENHNTARLNELNSIDLGVGRLVPLEPRNRGSWCP
jgi:hypothetical protein